MSDPIEEGQKEREAEQTHLLKKIELLLQRIDRIARREAELAQLYR
jgi:hypothetical protein